MYVIFIRTVLLYFFVILSIRLMGKRQVGQLQPYELVITIMLSDLASLPMQDERFPLLLGIIPIVTLLFSESIISVLEQKFVFMRKIFDGVPSIVISHGKFDLKAIKKQCITIDDVLEQLRALGYLDISEIQYAILENNGGFSVIPKSDNDNVKKQDLNITVKDPILPLILYMDGKINTKSLKEIHHDAKWLDYKLKKIKAPKKEDLFIVMLDSKGEIYYQKKDSDNIFN